ncbi:putative membrane protein [Mesorhizobium soli]|uniref:TPM domain-containing protein n=1 Tax=Pseudaminobacter soli (ex Li et al. 2025) TaxID=1295366 RepID=UPI0024760CFE|nr:TPM domain-containing protein [Mesorhizobium soli]MDH6231499.1 putative membrane protein [Mesorhizobium soli]
MAKPQHGMKLDEHARIANAVREAESKTSGEIYCVVARSSGSYFFPAACFLLGAILLLSLPVALALEYWWISLRLPVFVAAQLLAALAALALLWFVPASRLWFVPRRLRYRRAHDNALKQFIARNVHITTNRTGVLIFVSLAERYASVVADSGINQHVPQHAWDGVIRDLIAHASEDRLADGFVVAIGSVGGLLATHFPAGADNVNELDDHVVEI